MERSCSVARSGSTTSSSGSYSTTIASGAARLLGMLGATSATGSP
jgi:hypothetical protein